MRTITASAVPASSRTVGGFSGEQLPPADRAQQRVARRGRVARALHDEIRKPQDLQNIDAWYVSPARRQLSTDRDGDPTTREDRVMRLAAQTRQDTHVVAVAYAACALIWGTTWFAIRACIAGYPTLDAVALRFAIAAVVLVPLALRARPWPAGRTWLWLVAAGALDACSYALVYFGEERVPGGLAAVVYGTQPLVLALLLTAVRIEKLTRRHLVGALISLAGVAVIFLDRLDVSPRQALGIVMVLGSVVVATSYSMIMKRHGDRVNGLVSTTIFLGVTAIVLGILALAAREPVPWPPPVAPTVALLYLAIVGSVVAFLAYFWLLARTDLKTTSTLVFVFPLVALVTDALFEHAIPLGPRAYLGAAITLSGLVLSLLR